MEPFTLSLTPPRSTMDLTNERRPPSPEILLPEPTAEGTLGWTPFSDRQPPAEYLWRPLPISIPPGPRLVRVDAFASRSARTEEDELLLRLRGLRDQLLEEQDAVYDGETHSHDEMAAQDLAWNELDEKINAINELLRVFDPLELRSSR